MATSFFDDKKVIPDDNMVNTVLGTSRNIWDKLKRQVLENYNDLNQEWKFYSKKAGWSLVFKEKKRALFYFIPCEGYFKISLVFGEKAIEMAEQSSIPAHIMIVISEATSYAEGTSFFIDVKDEKALAAVITLIRIKSDS